MSARIHKIRSLAKKNEKIFFVKILQIAKIHEIYKGKPGVQVLKQLASSFRERPTLGGDKIYLHSIKIAISY